jgi:hypothetical protein
MTKAVLPAERFVLSKGSHGSTFKGEACVKELQTIAMGERFSDKPRCISPVIDRLEIALNDCLDDERRQRLLPFAYRALGTRDDGRDEERRQMCDEYLLHYALPTLLDKAGKTEMAARLRSLPGDLTVEGVREAIYEAVDEARDARKTAIEKIKNQILKELKKRKIAATEAAAATATATEAVAVAATVTVTVTAAVAATATVTEAVAATATATATEAVAATATATVTVTEAVAVAATVTATVTAAVAVTEAVAEAATEAATEAVVPYWAIREAVRKAVRAKVEELFKPTGDELLEGAIDLLDRMLPPEPLKPPVIENADVIFGVAA